MRITRHRLGFALRARRPLAWLVGVLLACVGALAAAQDLMPVPPLEGRVIDRTNTLDSLQRQAMEQHLANVERELGTQIVVLLINSTW